LEGGKLGAAETFMMNESTELMNQIMTLSGSGALYNKNPQQRRWRELRVGPAHQSANLSHYAHYSDAVLKQAAEQAGAA